MKIHKQTQKNKKVILFISGLVVLAGLSLAAYGYLSSTNDTNTNNQTNQSNDDSSNGDDDTKTNPPEPDTAPPVQVVPNYSVEITSIAQTNGYVTVESTIDSDKTGTCNFSFTSEGARPITRSSTSTGSDGPQFCNIRIAEVEFEKIGSWSANVRFSTNDSTTEMTKNVEIR